MKKKSLKPWIILIVAPVPLLILTALIQIVVRFVFSGAESESTGITTMVNIISLLIGIASVVSILCLPIWIAMLVITINNNKKAGQQTMGTNPTASAQSTQPSQQPPQKQ